MWKWPIACAALVASCIAAPPAGAYEPVGSDLRISNATSANDSSGGTLTPAIAFNPSTNQYLVAWRANNEGPGEDEIYTQLVSAAGVEQGTELQLSNAGGGGREAQDPAVAYSSNANEFLVVWEQDLEADNQYEVYGHRVSGTTGGALGSDITISTMSNGSTDANRDALNPAVAYNPTTQRYLVAWQGDGLVCMPACGDEQYDIWGREVEVDGDPLGVNEVIATVEDDLDPNRGGFNPALAYNSAANEFLVVYNADEITDDKVEIFGKTVGGPATPQISSTTGASSDARNPAIVSRGALGEYLVVWESNDTDSPSPEIYGQRVTTDETLIGAEIGVSEIGVANREAQNPAVAFSSAADEFMVTWEADRAANSQFEIFGQRVTGAGAETGAADFEISATPASDRDALSPAVAYSSTANEYLSVHRSDNLAVSKFEIFGHRLATPPGGGGGGGTPALVTPTGTTPAAGPTGRRAAALKKCKKKRTGKARKKCRKKAKKLPL